MTTPGVDPRSPERRARDEQIAAEPPLAPLDLPPGAPASGVETHLARHGRRPLAVAGIVENGLARVNAQRQEQHSRPIADQLDHFHTLREGRRARLMAVQARISRRRLQRKVGTTLTAIVDQIDGSRAIARSSADAPQIDGVISIDDARQLRVGEFARLRVTGSSAHDLRGRVVRGAAT